MIAKPTPAQSNAYDLRRADGSMIQGMTPNDIRQMALANDLYADDMICKTGDDRWRSAATLSGLPIRTRPQIVKEAAPIVVEAAPIAVEAAPVAPVVAVAPIKQIVEVVPDPQIEQANHRAEQLQSACDQLLNERDELLQRNDDARRESERANVEIERACGEIRRLQSESAAMIDQSNRSQSEVDRLTAAVEAARGDAERFSQASEQALSKIEKLSSVHAKACDEIDRLQSENGDILARFDHLTAQAAQGVVLQKTIDQLRQENASRNQAAREADEAHESKSTQLLGKIRDLTEQVRVRLDPSVGLALEEAVRERDLALQHVEEAIADREELVASLGHSQDAILAGEDLRRALEKTIATLKTTVTEHTDQLAQTRATVAESRTAYAALMARTEIAEAIASEADHAKAEAKAWIGRATEQRDHAMKERDAALADRTAALAERDSTRLAVGATQTDLVKVRRDFDALRSDFDSACIALTEQTARAAGLENAIATMRAQNQELTAERDGQAEDVAHLNEEIQRLDQQLQEQNLRGGDLVQKLATIEFLAAEMEIDRDSARSEAAALQGDLATAREAVALESQRQAGLERELAEERSRIVARDELIFRESLRSEQRETENRKLSADIAAIRADFDTQLRRADDATGQVAAVQRDLQEAKVLVAAQTAEMVKAHQDLENLTSLEQSARASLTAASRERDELAAALATAHAAVASREQQVSAERGLRDQAEGSSRQLLASYEKLADDTGRRITDLEIKLSEAGHDMQAVRVREEHLIASLAEAHAQSKIVAQKMMSIEEQRTAMTRDRDSHAKRAGAEASARAAAEDKINSANERANKAERDARATHERSVQAAMIALNGSKQRLDEDYAQSRAEIDVLEQLVAESSKRLIASGGTLPGVPLLPREASAKVAADAKAAAESAASLAAHVMQNAAQNAAQPLQSQRIETPVRSPAPQVNFRMIDGGVDDTAPSRPQAPRSSSVQNTTGRMGGQRERVSQSNSQKSSSSSDDDSSSPTSQVAKPPPTKNAQANTARRSVSQAVVDEAWLDDHCAADVAEIAPRSIGLVSITALGIVITATISALPEFHALDMRAAFTRIAGWVIAVPAIIAIVQLITTRCEPILARRIPTLAAIMLLIAPLSNLAFGSAPWIGAWLLAAIAALPWMMCYAAWPDARQVQGCRSNDLIVSAFASRASAASMISGLLAIIGITATLVPWTLSSLASHSGAIASTAIASPVGGIFALLMVSLIAALFTQSLRSHAPLVAWSALAVCATFFCSSCASLGIDGALTTIAPAAWIAFFAAWSAIAASSLASAHSPRHIAAAIEGIIEDDAPSLVAHERINAACVMALTALLPILPALTSFHLVRGRSRRAESQLRSLANFELWFAVLLAMNLLVAFIFPAPIGTSIFLGLITAHAAICLGAAITVGADRFVRFPSPAALLARPGGGLDLPLPLVTVQRTAENSPHRPIVHPCGTTTWGIVTVALGALAVESVTRNPALAFALGPIVGLAIWLPSLIASRCRHQDTLVLSGLATAMVVIVIAAGFMLDTAVNPDGIPMMVAITGAAAGVWALLVGWAFKGMTQLATLARASAQMEVDEMGETIAPIEHPLAARRRESLMRRVVIGASGVTAASTLIAVIPMSTPIIFSPLFVCGVLSLSLATTVWLIANLRDRSNLIANAGLFTTMLVASSFFAALPLFFRATELGALAALSALPFCAVAAISALLTAGIINTLREPKSLMHKSKTATRKSTPARRKTGSNRKQLAS
ncbi:MAG: hypothetical protein EBY29_05530 [Planctomycetes bacterium]|nr:hypothetical protein [Planctomycetota bacterium]